MKVLYYIEISKQFQNLKHQLLARDTSANSRLSADYYLLLKTESLDSATLEL